mgnify:CR=1 FL=1
MELDQALGDQHDWSRWVRHGLGHVWLQSVSLHDYWLNGTASVVKALGLPVIRGSFLLNSRYAEIHRDILVGPMYKSIKSLLLPHQKLKNSLGPPSTHFERRVGII